MYRLLEHRWDLGVEKNVPITDRNDHITNKNVLKTDIECSYN